MEQQDREPTPGIDIAHILAHIREGDSLEFTETGILCHTPEGEVYYPELSSLTERLEPPTEAYNDGRYADKINTVEFTEWTNSLLTPEAVKEAAEKELERREAEGDDGATDCNACQGQGYWAPKEPFAFDDIIVDPAVEPETYHRKCEPCKGYGSLAKYPRIKLYNELNNEHSVLVLDLASLIAQGEIDVTWSSSEKSYSGGFQNAERILHINAADYIDQAIARLGIDKENSMLFEEDALYTIPSERAHIFGMRAYWRQQEDRSIEAGFNTGHNNMTGAEVLNRVQALLANTFPTPFTSTDTNESGIEEWRIRPLRPIEEALEDLKTTVFARNYRLGFQQDIIDTEVIGPSFFLIDSNGKKGQRLSYAYDVREALENAWLSLQKY